LGETNERVVALDADLAQSTLTKFFQSKFPNRFFDMGIAEQGMVATAAGLALMGFRPFVTSYAMFVSGRAWEIVRQQISYGQAPVVVIGAHAGISVGKDGPTHQCMEDLAIMRVLPNLNVVVPCDYYEAFKAVTYAGNTLDPFYIRIGREKVPVVTNDSSPWELGKANVVNEGSDGTIIACGLMVARALDACELLAKDDIHPRVLNMHTIKPLDHDAIDAAARETGAILTVEEHSIFGGLGSAVAEHMTQSDPVVPMSIMGLNDRYLESGPMDVLLEQAGLTAEQIAINMRKLLARKR
jgi:transketolase